VTPDLDTSNDDARYLADQEHAARHDAESVFNPTFDEQEQDFIWRRLTR
jgi:hypothetical protein